MDNRFVLIVEKRLQAQGCLILDLWTLPYIRFLQYFQDQSLIREVRGKSGFFKPAAPPTKPRILNHKIFYPHMLVRAPLSFREMTFLTEVFSSFRDRIQKGCRRKNTSLVSVLSQSRLKISTSIFFFFALDSFFNSWHHRKFSTSNLFPYRKSNYQVFRQINWNSRYIFFFWSGSINYNFRHHILYISTNILLLE